MADTSNGEAQPVSALSGRRTTVPHPTARLFFRRGNLAPARTVFCIYSRMSETRAAGESRRSTRVPLKVVITAESLSEAFSCDGETVVVNRHGALICCTAPLRMGLDIEIRVILTDKRAPAKVIYVDPERPFTCGIALVKPENIWSLSLPPDDWYERMRET